MKPKKNKGYNTGTYDLCQTPPYALEPLYPYLNIKHTIWESAAGYKTLAYGLGRKGYSVIHSDVMDSVINIDFLQVNSAVGDVIITNPPYSIKYEFLEKCYFLEKPFALLMPVEMIGAKKAQVLFEKHGIEIIFMSPRVDFLMPYALWAGHGAQFPVAWYTWKLNLPREINFATLNKPKRKELSEYWGNVLGSDEIYNLLLKESYEHFIEEAFGE